MKSFLGWALAACLGLSACSSGAGGECAALDGVEFSSKGQGECGLGVNGVVYCTWTVTFSTGTDGALHYAWQHSDYGTSGTCTCDKPAMQCKGDDGTHQATINLSTMVLTWDGAEYQARTDGGAY